MTVASAVNRVSYAGNGVTTAFGTSPVIFFASSDLAVYLVVDATDVATLQTIATHYTVAGGDGATGTVTMLIAPATGETLLIIRTLPLTQSADFVQNDGSDADVVETALDRQMMVSQQLSTRIDRSFILADSDTSGASTELPVPVASTRIGWNDTATALQNYSPDTVPGTVVVSAFMETVLDDATAAAARATLGVASLASFFGAKGDLLAGTAAGAQANLAVGANGTTLVANSASSYGLSYAAALNKAIYGFTYANAAGDVVNDLDIAAGGCMDATGAYWITRAAITKQLDVAWAVGTNAGGLDTGAIGNNDYYIWAIARSDTGVTDILYSLSSTSPTTPANYDFKRLIGWFKRVGATIVLFTTYETEGGGIEHIWTTPTLDVDLTNALTTSRRTDAVKVPLALSTIAGLNVLTADASTHQFIIYCPDMSDLTPSTTVAPLSTHQCAAGSNQFSNVRVRTSATGTVASRATVATIDNYRISTLSFTWSRRN